MSSTRTDELHYLEALATFKLIDSISMSNDENLLIRLKSAYVKLDSIQEIINMCKVINNVLISKDTPILREWVEIIRNIHPKVMEEISSFEYFKPTSEEIGSRILGYYQDTQSLQLQDWDSNTPRAIRKNIEKKLNSDLYSLIQSNYIELNKNMVKNLSTEFYDERNRTVQDALTLQKRNIISQTGGIAHDFHIVGDYSYIDIVNRNKIVVESLIKTVLLDAIRLVNYITPVNISAEVKNDEFVIYPEEIELTVNRRKERISDLITEINNSVIIPVKVTE